MNCRGRNPQKLMSPFVFEVGTKTKFPSGCYEHFPSGTTRLAKPNSCASLAPISLPVRMRSSARDSPTNRGSRTVPPSIKGTPEGEAGRTEESSKGVHQIAEMISSIYYDEMLNHRVQD